MSRGLSRIVAAAVVVAAAAPVAAGGESGSRFVAFTVVGDAVPQPLTGTPGDPDRGRAIVADRQTGLCLLCHRGPFPDERLQGTLAPDLAGAGARWSEGQLRLRVADARQLNPPSLMPSYHRLRDPRLVGKAWQGRPLLDAQQVEDVVAFLSTLRP